MRLPNLLASRNGRLGAFFALYVTEGIPLGFAAIAVATQLRRMGVGPAAIGAFVASFYLPWAFKWAFGPVIDVFRSQRFGHRRAWILFTQLMMALTILALMAIPLPASLGLFTSVLLVHNTFGAMQDVAIDSLACNTLHEDERGLANGLMFAGANVGQAIGGSGVLYLMGTVGFQPSFVMVALSILLVTGFIVLPMKEALAAQLEQLPAASAPARATLSQAAGEMKAFAVQSFRSFLGSRGAFSAVFFGLLPVGAMCLGLALQSNLAVEFGMDDAGVALLNLWCTIAGAFAMVIGGMLSDKFGRRRMLGLYIVLMSFPVLYLWWQMRLHGYDMPRPSGSTAVPALITALWIASISYNVFNGMMYGTRAAIFMDVTNPKVAATQFTAYMALMNLAIAIAATWQGVVSEAFGYRLTLLIDVATGLICLLVLPMMTKPSGDRISDDKTEGRARKSAIVLGLCCLAFVPAWHYREQLGEGAPLMQTFFTLVFVSSALFLLAARAVMGLDTGRWRGPMLWCALLLLGIYFRKDLGLLGDGTALKQVAEAVILAVPVLGGVTLLALASRSWAALHEDA
ncbi:MFS transporter [Pelomonas sp. APW6]|uniref:MFS transporter n=1 Tax=Roseateles subflavus TaxID=3053353 RepID=A0ABT7LK60_9BURK|nr:MFS transporter [Pelomonas sp. APW6]MDL5031931.1 MFS transporter [Pelomonas sp. APW6]